MPPERSHAAASRLRARQRRIAKLPRRPVPLPCRAPSGIEAPRGYQHPVLAAMTAALLAALTPVVAHDAAERFPLTSAAAYAPVARTLAETRPAAYGRAVPARGGGTWLQYWLFYAYQ